MEIWMPGVDWSADSTTQGVLGSTCPIYAPGLDQFYFLVRKVVKGVGGIVLFYIYVFLAGEGGWNYKSKYEHMKIILSFR